jgi:hypothetical protein
MKWRKHQIEFGGIPRGKLMQENLELFSLKGLGAITITYVTHAHRI